MTHLHHLGPTKFTAAYIDVIEYDSEGMLMKTLFARVSLAVKKENIMD